MQERLEAAAWGRVLISAVLVVTLFSVMTANLYPSDLKRQFWRVGKPVVYATGLDQGWDVFAPDVRRQTIKLEAHVAYADGTSATWRIPRGGSLFGAYWDYRWRKWAELMILGFAPREIEPGARWIARHAEPGRRAVKIELVERYQQLGLPGTSPNRGPWTEKSLYELDLQQGSG